VAPLGQPAPLAAPPIAVASGRPGRASPLADWAPRGRTVGLYLHVPFCVRRCGYCTFTTAPHDPHAYQRYLDAVAREIDLVGATAWARSVDVGSVFLGGGTPSLLAPRDLAHLLERVGDRFDVAAGAEVTVECNPESVSRERLAGYREAGVTRASLGVQSLDDDLLRALDRLHGAAEARDAYDATRAAGFEDISVDLIYGLPGLDLPTWERTLREVLSWEPDHLSAYALTLDEGSRWTATGVRGLPHEDAVVAQYWLLTRVAAAAGYEHYEISNYARPGHRSAHNQVYWRAEEYLALGPGACGFLGRVRYANVKPLARYCEALEAGALPLADHETLTDRQLLAERLILGLRLADGVPAAWLHRRVALEPRRLPAVLEAWTERGLLVTSGGRSRLTEAGFLLSDALFADLL
jgi:oxygen-independent coproporphyrinogen-3 oxidase